MAAFSSPFNPSLLLVWRLPQDLSVSKVFDRKATDWSIGWVDLPDTEQVSSVEASMARVWAGQLIFVGLLVTIAI